MRNRNQGFTVLELIFGLVIVAILVTIAVPSYHKSIRKARRADARAGLLELQIGQERFRGNCIQFAAGMGTNDICNPTAGVYTLRADGMSPEGYYLIAIVNGSVSATGYAATARAVGTQSNDQACALITLTVDSSNPRGIITPATCL